jgi:hypothetical protein
MCCPKTFVYWLSATTRIYIPPNTNHNASISLNPLPPSLITINNAPIISFLYKIHTLNPRCKYLKTPRSNLLLTIPFLLPIRLRRSLWKSSRPRLPRFLPSSTPKTRLSHKRAPLLPLSASIMGDCHPIRR